MIIPLLKLNDEEQILAIEDPQELIYLSLDLMEKCQSETIKTCAVKLLHKLRERRRWYAFLYGGLLPETNLPLYRLPRK